MFQDLVNGEECVTGSGRCCTHNVKQVRSVVKNILSLDEIGETVWTGRRFYLPIQGR